MLEWTGRAWIIPKIERLLSFSDKSKNERRMVTHSIDTFSCNHRNLGFISQLWWAVFPDFGFNCNVVFWTKTGEPARRRNLKCEVSQAESWHLKLLQFLSTESKIGIESNKDCSHRRYHDINIEYRRVFCIILKTSAIKFFTETWSKGMSSPEVNRKWKIYC